MDRNLRRLGIGAAVRTLGAAIYNPFLALFLVNVLHLRYVEVGGIIAAVGVVLLPFSLVGGFLTDRIGRRSLILMGLFGEAAATGGLAYGFWVQSLGLAIAAALAGGLITSVAGPATSAYIADLAVGSERTRAFTFYRVGFNAGFSVGVALGGFLIAVVGFAGSVAVAAGIILGGATFVALTLDPSERDRPLRDGSTGSTSSSATVPRERSPPVRESFARLVHDRNAREALLAFGFAALTVGQWAVTFPLYVHNVLGVPYAVLGVGLALNGLVVVFGQTWTTERAVGHRHTSLAVLGIGFYVLAFLGLGVAGLVEFAPSAVFLVSVVVLTFGENLLSIPQTTLPSNLAPAGEIGSYNGAFAMIGGAGFLASVVLGGAVLSATSNPLLVWLYLVLPGLPAVVLLRHVAGRLGPDQDRA